ncbi:MAG: DNA repair protein RecO [Chitinophagaceae bacterium]
MQLVSTKGIVLRSVKYSETSLVVTIYTRQLGTQSYIVSGVRSSQKSSNGKANYFVPAAILDLVVYNNRLKNLNRIKEFKWDYLYQHLFFDIYKNTIAIFCIELLQKTLKQPDIHFELYDFLYENLMLLDATKNSKILANFPIYFMGQIVYYLGLKILNNYNEKNQIFNIQEGCFTHEAFNNVSYIEGELAYHLSQCIQIKNIGELATLHINNSMRTQLIGVMEHFFQFHITDFGKIYSLPILQQILR